MISMMRDLGSLVRFIMERLAFALVLVLGIGLLGYSIACALGAAPWLTLDLRFGETMLIDVGMYVQLFVAAIALSLCFFLPSTARIMRLETSHRTFQMGMKDVARAYSAAHSADREGVFKLTSEFDSIRERMAFLRDHPDLTELEPSVMELASQMSHVARELADVYSDRNVSRARDFLTQRQTELEQFNERLNAAKATAADLRNWHTRLATEESVARTQLNRLSEELTTLMPELTLKPEVNTSSDAAATGWKAPNEGDDRVIGLLQHRAAE